MSLQGVADFRSGLASAGGTAKAGISTTTAESSQGVVGRCGVRGALRAHRLCGFTLIELLVVVAIIALLIAVLLPSLNRSREQARTTVCLSRISQLGKALMGYADDFCEVFPFTSTLHESRTQGPNAIETWLANWSQGPTDAIKTVAYSPQESWGDEVSRLVPRTGTLFPYARFENLYRCPDFERQQQSLQHVFNYSRAAWGRIWRLYWEYTETPPPEPMWGGFDGPILRACKIYNPAKLPLLLDEQWDRHIGTAGMLPDDGSAYLAADYGFYIHDVVAASHGAPVTSDIHKYDFSLLNGNLYDPYLWRRGGVFCYDGHAELQRDPWPTMSRANSRASNGMEIHGSLRGPPPTGADRSSRFLRDEYPALMEYSLWIIYAQRGMDPRAYAKPLPAWQ
jgi:prepilin-type N-terminal cleavage/methylation domain-containing protein